MKKLLLFFIAIVLWTSLTAQNATINFEIIDLSTKKPTPAKMVILQDGEPFDHELTSTADLACKKHTIYARTGKGSFELPPGEYQIWFGKGMEYSVITLDYIFDKGQTAAIKAVLKRELNPKGYIGGDMHLHTYTYSKHGDATVEERLISCVAEGLEWAVATDHNKVLDYAPYMKKLGLERYMATTIGNEVSTPIGHFNTYPLAADSEKVNDKITVGKELFETIRSKGMEHTLVQINHPRWVETDFFNTKGLDPFYGKSKHPEWDWNFDAFEILNENFGIGWRDAPDNKFSVKQDWFNLLNQGINKTGVGNSDSHSVIAQIAGVPRNYIQSSTDKPTEIDEVELAKNIANHKVSVACGIFANMMANGKQGIGSTVRLEGEQKTFELQLQVQAPSWVSCHKAELIENGEVIQTFTIPENRVVMRLDTTITLQPKKDSWYVLIAYGDKPMTPMVQFKEKPVMPIGFTNPIWADADGNGTLTSIYDYSDNLRKDTTYKAMDLVEAMEADAALVYPLFYHLFENKDERAIQVANLYLRTATTRQKQLLYRELSKIGGGIATNILKNEKRTKLIPLEEVALNYYWSFPLHQNKVERFKKQENTQLDEQLNTLEDAFRYVYSGATRKQLSIAKSSTVIAKAVNQEWMKTEQPANSILPIGDLLKEQEGKYLYLHYPLYSRKNTDITFYINVNTNLQISDNGQILKAISNNNRFPLSAKLVKLPIKKGKNNLLFRLDAKDKVTISLQEIDLDKLLDANLENTKTVEHLALDKKVNYITEYVPQYHGNGVALTDGYRGTTDFLTQLWQGWNSENAEFVIDLGAQKTIDAVTVGLLINQDYLIFGPKTIQCSFSTDGVNFSNAKSTTLDASIEQKEAITKDVEIVVETLQARYVKIICEQAVIPDWHMGKGGDGWIVLDEVLVE